MAKQLDIFGRSVRYDDRDSCTISERIVRRGWRHEKSHQHGRRAVYDEHGELIGHFTAKEMTAYIDEHAP